MEMEQEMRPEGTRGALGTWQKAVQHAQTGRLEDLEANLGKLSDDGWNAMVKNAEEAWENVQQRKPAALAWLQENAEAIDRARVMDTAFRNARANSDKENARIEHDRALQRVMTAVMKDDTELFKQFVDNEGFRRWMSDTVFGLAYEQARNREADNSLGEATKA